MAVLAALFTAVLATTAVAQESRVLLVYPEPPSALLAEALVHVRGEFGSVGLSVQVIATAPEAQDIKPTLAPGTYGALVFEERADMLIMRAYHPSSQDPIVQRLFTRDGRVTPHVVAVRGVETLRAALQQYYYSTNRQVPEAVKRIARIEEQPPTHEKPPAPAPPPPPPPGPEPGMAVALWLAPLGMYDVATGKPAAGVAGALTVGRRWYRASANFDTTLVPFRLDDASGSADVHRLSVSLGFRAHWALTSDAALFARVAGGLSHYAVEGKAAPGFVGKATTHQTPMVLVGVGGEYWLSRWFGVFLSAHGALALNAPVIQFAGVPTERFERPMLGLAVGGVVGAGR